MGDTYQIKMAGVGSLIDAIQDMQAVTNFEKFVIITLKFFSVNRFIIGIDLADLMNQYGNIPLVFNIPGNWRNGINETQLQNQSMLYCGRYDVQCNEQRFVLLITQADGILNVSLRHQKTNNDRRVYTGAIADRKFEEFTSGTTHTLKFVEFVQDFLREIFKYPISKAFKNEEPEEFCPHYVY